MNEGSADTLSYNEKDHGTHPTTLPHLRLIVNFILGSGRTIGRPTNEASRYVDVWSRNASGRLRPCRAGHHGWLHRRSTSVNPKQSPFLHT